MIYHNLRSFLETSGVKGGCVEEEVPSTLVKPRSEVIAGKRRTNNKDLDGLGVTQAPGGSTTKLSLAYANLRGGA